MSEMLAIATGASALGGSVLLAMGGSSPLLVVAPMLGWGVIAWSGVMG